jgi:hypothetical protein
MDSSKAKQAKSKAKARTKQKAADANQQQQQQRPMDALYNEMAAQGRIPGTGLTPEIQAQQIAMQGVTQTVNPYHRMGMMPANYYNPGNVVGGGLVPGS